MGSREPTTRPTPAKPVKVNNVDILRLRFKDAEGDTVPALLCTPAGKAGPFPLVVAIHGMNSNKAQVCGQLAPALIRQGFAVLAPDMPVHGERPGGWAILGGVLILGASALKTWNDARLAPEIPPA